MALSAFDDKSKKPQPKDLEQMLGRTNAHWKNLIAHIGAAYAPLEEAWSFSGDKWGWSLRLKRKKRTILYMTPCRKHFLVGFVLGERAVKAARESTLSDTVISIIEEAPKYAEGTGFRLEIRNRKALEEVQKLAAIKMAK